MIYLENYLYDGACWQARAVMCYLQSRVESILEKTYTGDAWMPYKGKAFINQYHYGREKGYVFSVYYNGHQANYAVYEHCISDCICVVKGNAVTEHSDGWDGKEWSKYDHDKEFGYGETTKCGEWIENDMRKEVAKWTAEESKEEYDREKAALVSVVRNFANENGGLAFNEDGTKVFNPIYCGEPRREEIVEVFADSDEEDCDVVVITKYDDEGQAEYERTYLSNFSNDEIREIISLLGIE